METFAIVRSSTLVMICLLYVGSCTPRDRVQIPAGYGRLLELPSEQRLRELRGLDPDTLINLYLYGVESFHPPRTWLADELAQSRVSLGRALAQRLNTTTKRSRLSFLVDLARVLACQDSSMTRNPDLSGAVGKALSRGRISDSVETMQIIEVGCPGR